ncbi:type VI secretion system-associated FHA domain protein TagH [Pseudomonas sp. NPDC089554]|uniref:type VI secretion system-associated FHA domain protein TagH n=1 Tax=Pseudomonas sp. NPDC089554 TaxID=3390653 RepID=UPI003D046D37
MPVKLLVKHYRGQPPAAELSCLIDTVGTLGRAVGNDLVLDDPGKYISRAHARIEQRPEGYYLVDIGSNPSVVNERLLGHGREALLQSADVLVIGDYQIDVALLDESTSDPDQTSADGTQTLAVFVPPAPPQPTPLPPSQPVETPRSSAGFSQPQVQTDALAAASILQGEASFEPSTPLADPLGLGLLAGSAPPALFDMAPAPVFAGVQSDHLSPEQHALPPTPAPLREESARIPEDYDALADRLAEPPQPQPVVPVEEPPAPVAAPVSSDSAVLDALLDGLGLPQLRTSRSPQALARLVGEMLREATGGTMGVLMTRALTKRESHIEMTMIGAHSNNPLKFFPDATSALSQMLSTDAPAYLAGVPALRAAFDDLRAHEMAVIAGMREALSEVVQRFEPERIAQGLAAPSALQRLLPSTRQAQLWARFSERYAQLVRDGDEDLQRIFVEKFSSAYQQQVSRLRDLP